MNGQWPVTKEVIITYIALVTLSTLQWWILFHPVGDVMWLFKFSWSPDQCIH